MNKMNTAPGGAPVGVLMDLDSIPAAVVIYLRLWCDGPVSRAQVEADFASLLGPDCADKTLRTFDQMCDLCARHGRRPLMRHAVQCTCLGADESCFAHFVATATEGAREDAMLIATLLVRPDIAPLLASLAAEFGLALKRMHLGAPRDMAQITPNTSRLH